MEYESHHWTKHLYPRNGGFAQNQTGYFNGAHNFGIWGSQFYDIHSYQSENFMKKFAEETIPGAAFDSSQRDPPPRCHPGTRLSIVERALRFFSNQDNNPRFLWLVGPAGVGKSAIMQTLAETPPTTDYTLGASLFFSVNGRTNGSKAIITLAYQIAVKLKPYRDFVESAISGDPTLFGKAIILQFNKLIVEPFVIHKMRPEGHKRFLIFIDGLDECQDQRTHCLILGLISYFSTKYPTAPLVWVVASRPEPHITRFLSQPSVISSYVKEEIQVDSDEACEDVERFLREELGSIQVKYPELTLSSRWPSEHDFLKLAAAARGLFAYGTTVIKYIDDPVYATPISRLQQVLEVIDGVHSKVGEIKKHPMANLDALYARILSQIPKEILVDTKKLLLMFLPDAGFFYPRLLPVCCDWLGMAPDVAYGSLRHLHSVLHIPSMESAFDRRHYSHHKSFPDFLGDYNRSGLFSDYRGEQRKLHKRCILRILDETSKARQKGLNTSAGLPLSWPQRDSEDFEEHRLHLYANLFSVTVECLKKGRLDDDLDLIGALRCFDVGYLIEHDQNVMEKYDYPLQNMPAFLFKEPILSKLRELHVLEKIPLGLFDISKITAYPGFDVCMYTKRSKDSAFYPGEWCDFHQWDRDFGEIVEHGDFWCYPFFFLLPFPGEVGKPMCSCNEYIQEVFKGGKSHSPHHLLTTFIDITGRGGWVCYEFDDPGDELTWWRFIVLYQC